MYTRDSLSGKFNKLYYINNKYINDSLYLEVTPYLSINNNTFLFVRNKYSLAETDVLYIAYNFKEIDNIIDYMKKSGNVNIYPNPVENYIEILPVNIYNSFDYCFFNISGQKIITGSFKSNTRLDISNFTKGVYIIKLIDRNENTITYHKIIKL